MSVPPRRGDETDRERLRACSQEASADWGCGQRAETAVRQLDRSQQLPATVSHPRRAALAIGLVSSTTGTGHGRVAFRVLNTTGRVATSSRRRSPSSGRLGSAVRRRPLPPGRRDVAGALARPAPPGLGQGLKSSSGARVPTTPLRLRLLIGKPQGTPAEHHPMSSRVLHRASPARPGRGADARSCIAGAVGYSRCYLGVHFPSDVGRPVLAVAGLPYPATPRAAVRLTACTPSSQPSGGPCSTVTSTPFAISPHASDRPRLPVRFVVDASRGRSAASTTAHLHDPFGP